MTFQLSDNDLEKITNNVVEKLASKLPPLLCAMMKDMMPGAINQYEEERENNVRTKRNAENFMHYNPSVFNKHLKARKDKFQQYSRSVHIVDLYDECMQESPPYIPRKFREDKFKVRNERELEKVFNRSMANFQCEYDILTIRKVDYKEQLDMYTTMVQQHLDEQDLDIEVKTEIMNIWSQDVKKDEEKITKEWRKKIEGVKKSFVIDKADLIKINNNRFRETDSNRVPTSEASTPNVVAATPTTVDCSSATATTTTTTIPATTNTTAAVTSPITSSIIEVDTPEAEHHTPEPAAPAITVITPTATTTVTSEASTPSPNNNASDEQEPNNAEILADDTILNDSTHDNIEPANITEMLIEDMANQFQAPFRSGDARDQPPRKHNRRDTHSPAGRTSRSPSPARSNWRTQYRQTSPSVTRRSTQSRRRTSSPSETRASARSRRWSPPRAETRRSTRFLRITPSPVRAQRSTRSHHEMKRRDSKIQRSNEFNRRRGTEYESRTISHQRQSPPKIRQTRRSGQKY